VLGGLKKREEGIRANIADAEASRKKAEAALQEYNQKLASAESQMRDILSKAAADAEKLATQMKMTAQQEVEEIKERATRDIDAARKAALSDIYAQAAELSTSIASKILKRNINADDQRDLVNSSIQQFSTAGKA
jgi:F-type H+-transporting ATPase subunit b